MRRSHGLGTERALRAAASGHNQPRHHARDTRAEGRFQAAAAPHLVGQRIADSLGWCGGSLKPPFRPRRSAHDALQVLIDETWRGRRWVAESDIANCFEAIPHSGLMSAIEERIVDRQILKLLRAMLRAGVMEDRAIRRSDAGTPQGGVISPCLCNVYLHRLDRQWTERGTDVPDPSRGRARPCGVAGDPLGVGARTPRRGSCSCAKVVTGWIFSASNTAGCAATRVPHGISGSSAAGPHARPCSAPATGSVSSRIGAGCWWMSMRSCRTSTASCAAGRATSAMETPPDSSTRSTITRRTALRGSWPSAKRNWGYGLKVVLYQSPDRLGLINLEGTIVAPRPNRPWRRGR